MVHNTTKSITEHMIRLTKILSMSHHPIVSGLELTIGMMGGGTTVKRHDPFNEW